MSRVGKKELLRWAQRASGIQCSRLDDLKNGAIFIQIFHSLFPVLVESMDLPQRIDPRFMEDGDSNWELLHALFDYLRIPASVCDQEGIQKSQPRSCYNFLVLLFFLETLITDRQLQVDFVNPVDPVLAEYLQSQNSLDTIATGRKPLVRHSDRSHVEDTPPLALRPDPLATFDPAESEPDEQMRSVQPRSPETDGMTGSIKLEDGAGDSEPPVVSEDVVRLLARIDQLTVENRQLRARKAGPGVPETDDKDGEIHTLTLQVSGLRRQLDLADREHEMVQAALTTRISDLERIAASDVAAAQLRLQSQYAVDLAAAHRETELLQDRLLGDLDDMAGQVELAAATAEGSEEETAGLKQTVAALHSQLEAMRRAYERSTTQREQMGAEVLKLRETVADTTRSFRAMDNDASLGGGQDASSEVKAVVKKARDAQAELAAAQTRVARLEARVEALQQTGASEREVQLRAETVRLGRVCERLAAANQYMRQRTALFDSLNAEIEHSTAALTSMRVRDAVDQLEADPIDLKPWVAAIGRPFSGDDETDGRHGHLMALLGSLSGTADVAVQEQLRELFWEMVSTEQVHADRLARCRHYIKAQHAQLEEVKARYVEGRAVMERARADTRAEMKRALAEANDAGVKDKANTQVALHLLRAQHSDLQAEFADLSADHKKLRQIALTDGDARFTKYKQNVRVLKEQLACQKLREDLWKSLVNTHREYIKIVKEMPAVPPDSSRGRELSARKGGLERATAGLIEQLNALVDGEGDGRVEDDEEVTVLKEQIEVLNAEIDNGQRQAEKIAEGRYEAEGKLEATLLELQRVQQNEESLVLEIGDLRQSQATLHRKLDTVRLDADSRVQRLQAEVAALTEAVTEQPVPLVADSETDDGRPLVDDDDVEALDDDVEVLINRVGQLSDPSEAAAGRPPDQPITASGHA